MTHPWKCVTMCHLCNISLKKDSITSLNRDFLHTVKTKAEGYVIYANLCTLSNSELEKWHITFKKIPRDISRL